MEYHQCLHEAANFDPGIVLRLQYLAVKLKGILVSSASDAMLRLTFYVEWL